MNSFVLSACRKTFSVSFLLNFSKTYDLTAAGLKMGEVEMGSGIPRGKVPFGGGAAPPFFFFSVFYLFDRLKADQTVEFPEAVTRSPFFTKSVSAASPSRSL